MSMSAATTESPAPAANRAGWTVAAGMVLVGLLALWLGRSALDATAKETLERAAVAAKITVLDLPLPQGALELPIELPDGRKVPLLQAALAEQSVVLVNFWATWCPPCLDEMPSWLRLASVARQIGIGMVAVSYDDDWASQRQVLSGGGTALPGGVAWGRDPAGQGGDEATMLRTRFGTAKLPETWIVTRGRIVGRFVGAQRWDAPELLRYLQQLARQP